MEKLKTRTFKVNGIVVKVVTVMGFARIIGKSASTVRRYEHEGTIPPCIFKIKGYRYYPVSLAEETAKIIERKSLRYMNFLKTKGENMPTKSTLKKPALEVRNDASVYYEKSLTKNLGDYNSAKITVGITLPINPTEEVLASVKSTIEIADNIVTEELKVQVADLDEK